MAPPRLLITPYSRDMAKRQTVASNELLRRAFKYVARNTTLPLKVRHQAQLQLNSFPNNSRPEIVRERCVASGKGRGIFTEFGLCRVSLRGGSLSAGRDDVREKASRSSGRQPRWCGALAMMAGERAS